MNNGWKSSECTTYLHERTKSHTALTTQVWHNSNSIRLESLLSALEISQRHTLFMDNPSMTRSQCPFGLSAHRLHLHKLDLAVEYGAWSYRGPTSRSNYNIAMVHVRRWFLKAEAYSSSAGRLRFQPPHFCMFICMNIVRLGQSFPYNWHNSVSH